MIVKNTLPLPLAPLGSIEQKRLNTSAKCFKRHESPPLRGSMTITATGHQNSISGKPRRDPGPRPTLGTGPQSRPGFAGHVQQACPS